ncbi:DUF3325 domain-containing protein [Methylophaga sp.]|uniref:DUF3325 domain-containing protein n=1 Tax=Methylophaga sp. TaxID=2024840 RepID=UPI0027270510|nr:DUF3325 domain-containing protein [Methylophaga sp.]MDO8828332.1 DUF3325 domain-containing protein [Methylophaga sp.]
MTTLLATLSAISLAFAGMTRLAMNMDRHYRQLPKQHSQRMKWRSLSPLIASLLLSASLIAAIISQGVGNGLVLWFGILTITTFALAMLFTYRPETVITLGWSAVLVGSITMILFLIG